VAVCKLLQKGTGQDEGEMMLEEDTLNTLKNKTVAYCQLVECLPPRFVVVFTDQTVLGIATDATLDLGKGPVYPAPEPGSKTCYACGKQLCVRECKRRKTA